jgi:WD40 repeat protein
VLGVAFSPDGKTLASRSNGHTVRLWDVATAKEMFQLPIWNWRSVYDLDGPGAVAFSPDGTHLAVRVDGPFAGTRTDTAWQLWDLKTRKKVAAGAEAVWAPNAVSFSPDGEAVATAAAGGVRLWSARTATPLRLLEGPSPTTTRHFAFAADNRRLVAGGCSMTVPNLLVWEWGTGDLVRTLPGTKSQVAAVALSPGGHVIVSCSGKDRYYKPDLDVYFWELASGTRIRALKGHQGAVTAVALSPDGRILATAGFDDQTVRLWDVFGGKELAKFTGHAGPVLCVAFAPDGKLLASGSADTTILLWDVSAYHVTPPKKDAEPKRLAQLWSALREQQAAGAFEAVWALAGGGDKAVAFLEEHLKPYSATEADRVRKLLAGLDGDDFSTRQKAEAALAELGALIEPALRQCLAGKPSRETQRRVRDLMSRERAEPAVGEGLRQGRAILTLELIGTPRARELLRRLAGGAPGATCTDEAKSALGRLTAHAEDRPGPSP